MRNLFLKLLWLTAVFTAPFALHAQDNASLTGVVTDSTGAVLGDSTVILTNESHGLKFTQTTDSKGTYRFQNVLPDQGYTVTFSHGGFTSFSVKKVALVVGITTTQNAKLAAGSTTEVEVTADNQVATLNTTDATIGNNFDVTLVQELPVLSRSNVASLFLLQPGVGAGGAFTGARTDQSSVTVDGMDVNNVSNGQNLAVVAGAPVDSVQEFRGTVAGLVSSQGTGSGGQFQLVTKSGTNRFHGNINEYHRDTSTVANTWFNNNFGLPRTPLIRNQFGGNLGGPILRDRLYFFIDFNNDRIAQSIPQRITIPTASFLAGNLSYINSNPGCTGNSRFNTTPNCISVLPNTAPAGQQSVTSLDPLGRGFSAPLLQVLNSRFGNLTGGQVDVTGGDGVNTQAYRFNAKFPSTGYGSVARIDYNLTPKQRIFVRYTNSRVDQIQAAPLLPSDPVTSPYSDRSYGYVISHIWQIGSNKVNQFYYGETVDKENFSNTFNPAGSTSLSTSKYIAGFVSGPFAGASVQTRRVPVPEVRDDFNMQIGAHSITVGGTFKFIKTNSFLLNDFNFVTVGLSPYTALSSRQAPRGGTAATTANFSSTTAIYDYFGAFNVALGSIAEVDSNYNYDLSGNATPQDTGTHRHYRFYQTELYAGDTWKVSPHLTVDYGLRYQLYSVPYETTGFESVQNLSYQQLLNARVAQSNSAKSGNNALPLSTYVLGGKYNNGPNTYSPSYKDIAPRVAFSYNPGSTRTVINGSAGLVFDRTVTNAVDFIQDQNSQLFQQTLTSPQFAGYSNPRLGNIVPGSADPSFVNPNPAGKIPHPYTPNIDVTGNSTGQPGALDGLINNSFTEAIDPNLKTPYSINYNVGIQQEFPDHFIMKLNYVGRLGRRLLAQVDASQLIDFPDPASGQTLASAITNLEGQVRRGGAITPIPFFENVLGKGTYCTAQSCYGEPNETQLLVDEFGSLLSKGDFADTVQGMAGLLVLPANVGLASQFAGDTYVTNGGFSSYNGLLLTITKNLRQGLQFDFNYTWSHSIDNTSQVANSIASGSGYGFLCDVLRPRECRGNSDFDVANVVNGDFVYLLPFGHDRAFAAHAPRWVDEAIGGWSVSGIPQWRGGVALTTSTTSYVAGYANNAPAILRGNPSDLRISKHKSGSTLYGFAGCSTATCGNLVPDTTNATGDFAYPTGFAIGSRNNLRTPSSLQFDAGVAKLFSVVPEKVSVQFRADFFNVLNHPVFSAPNTDISQSTGSFGQITSTIGGSSQTGARVGQFSLRLDF